MAAVKQNGEALSDASEELQGDYKRGMAAQPYPVIWGWGYVLTPEQSYTDYWV